MNSFKDSGSALRTSHSREGEMKVGDRGRELITRYDNVTNQIMRAIFKSSADPFYRSSLEDLQKTVRSMEPMVEDMEVSEIASPRYTFMTRKFLPLLEQLEYHISLFLECELPPASYRVGNLKASIFCQTGIELPPPSGLAISYKNKLDIIREILKDLFADYVKKEMETLASSNQEGRVIAVADRNELRELLRYLPTKIRDEASKASSKPVFAKIILTLDFLEMEIHSGTSDISLPHNMPRILHLLKEIKLLHRFLDGDHGLDIPNRLQERENALRKFVTDKVVVSRLKEKDQDTKKLEMEKEIRKTFWKLLLAVLMYACLLDMPEYLNCPISYVVILTYMAIFVVLLAYTLAIQVSTQHRLGQSDTHRQTNPCCGWFLQILVAVLGTIVLAMAFSDEPKRYDIFLNFRGSNEIRYTVAGVFHSSLEKENIRTFFDERSSRKTKRFLKEIENAIVTSVGAIAIFSEHYGESEYCLDELLLILEREKTYKGYIIRPIFYDVEPDDLTDPESKFGQGLQKHYNTKRKEKVEEWEEALEIVTQITGDVHNSTRQHLDELVNKVVEDFKHQLGKIRATEDNTTLMWRRLTMKAAKKLLRHVKLVIDLRKLMFYVTSSGSEAD